MTPEKEVERLLMKIIGETSLKVFSVGGFVRDELLGIESKDLDIVVEKEGGAKELAEFIHSKFPLETSNPHLLGAGYPIWHISFKRNINDFKTEGAEIDIADTQKESFPDPTTRQRITEPGTINDDCKRRDFTCNMLLRDLSNGQIVDLTGVSISDLNNKILRGHPQVSWEKMFSDDPLRIIRMIRFYCKYDMTIPFTMLRAAKMNGERFQQTISGERIRDELEKIMKLGKLNKALKLMKAIGFLKYVLPEVNDMVGVAQGTDHHFEGDVFVHTMLVLSKAKPTVEAQLGALCHDLGKVTSRQIIDGKTRFFGHELASGDITRKLMTRLHFDNATIDRVVQIVVNHMKPHFSEKWKAKTVRKFVEELGDNLDNVLELSEIDSDSSLGPDSRPSHSNKIPLLREKIKDALIVPLSTKTLITGVEIMELLGIREGKEVGRAVAWVKDKREDYASEKKILTKEEAISLLLKDYL